MVRRMRVLLSGALALAIWVAAPRLGPAQSDPGSARRCPLGRPALSTFITSPPVEATPTFFVLPDGTTLLVDAGAAGNGRPETDPHPDATRSPGEWIARYLKRQMPTGHTEIDFAMITHFHPDHMGQVTAAAPLDRTGAYKLTGITEVDATLPIRTLMDRGWPDYSVSRRVRR